MDRIERGNALEESGETRGWFVGAFIDSQGLQRNSGVEIKYGKHPQGESHTSKAGTGEITSIGILVYGRYGITFDTQEEIVLEKEGDYLIWKPNIPHKTKAYEDSLIITIRWPSASDKKK